MRESWTDTRLDEFTANVDRRFDAVDQRFDAVDRRFNEVDRRIDDVDKRLERVEDTLGSLVRAVIFGFIGMSSAMVAGFVAIVGALITQL